MHCPVQFPGFIVRAPLLNKDITKENTFLPLHTGKTSAETLVSVNNTTNEDTSPYLSLKKKKE